jgi:DNA-binding SARP family transcriptional activator
VLGGGVAADRDSVRLELSEVRLDVNDLHAAAEADEFRRVIELYRGEFLPLDLYEDWASEVREHARSAYARAARELAIAATATGDHDQAAAFARRILATDPYDEEAHRRLIAALAAGGHSGAARQAHVSYVGRMDELGAPSVSLAELVLPVS